ncbi:hypothetical protein, partial [Vibrio vulnificus]
RLRGTKIIEQKFSLHQLNKVRSRPYRFNLLVALMIFAVSCYELLANENLWYGLGTLFTFVLLLVFASASEFKRKYLSHE